MADHHQLSNFIWQIADLLRGPYRPPQYERVMLPLVVLRRFDCVLRADQRAVLPATNREGSPFDGEALDSVLNSVAGQRFHNHSPLDFEKLKGDPDNIDKHLVSYINGFSGNVREIFERFELARRDRADAGSQYPLFGYLQILRHRPAPGTQWTISKWGCSLRT